MKNFINLLKMDVSRQIKSKSNIFYLFIYPILLILLLGYLTSSTYQQGLTSYDYYGITIITFFILGSSIVSLQAIKEEKSKKANTRILSIIDNSTSFLLSKIISVFLLVIFFSLITIVLSIIFLDVNFGSVTHVMIVLLPFIFFSSTIGVTLGILFKNEELIKQLLNLFINISAILGGTFFSIGALSVLNEISIISPLKWMNSVLFQMIFDNNFSLYYLILIVNIILSIIFIVISTLKLKREKVLY